MNFGLYILGNPKGKYGQYPDDYTAETYEEFVAGVQGSRLIVHRDKDLAHYVYAENLGEGRVCGFSVVFNSATIGRPTLWASYCHAVIEDMLAAGQYIHFDDDRNVNFAVDAVCDCPEEYERIRTLVGDEMESNPHKYGIASNERPVTCVKEVKSVSMDSDDGDVIALSEKYSTIVIDDTVTLNDGYLNRLIATLKDENVQARDQIKSLTAELVKRKRRTWAVGILSFIVIAGMAGGWYAQRYHQNVVAQNESAITHKNAEINRLKDMIAERDSTIAEKDDTLLSRTVEIAERDSVLRVRDYAISTRDAKIAEKDRLLQEQTAQINSLMKKNRSQANQIASAKEEISLQAVSIVSLKQTIREKDERIAVLEEEISSLKKRKSRR